MVLGLDRPGHPGPHDLDGRDDAARDVAPFYSGSNALIGAKDRIAGLSLSATDIEWTHGDGPEVSGPIMPLVMAMTGRAPAVDALSGAGVDTLRQRCG
ncbi:MAG: hypothetical protein ABI243_01995 [Lapillicoccus sp.]